MIVVRDKQALTRRAVASTILYPQRPSVNAEAGTELDAEVGAGNLDGGGAGVVDEALSVGTVAVSAR